MNRDTNPQVTIHFDIWTAIRTTFLIVGVLMFINVLGDIMPTIKLVGMAFFLALALNPAVSRIARMLPSRSRVMATGASFILVVAFLAGFFAITGPPIAHQISEFAGELPSKIDEFKTSDNFLANTIDKYDIDTEIREAASKVADRLTGDGDGLIGTVNRLTSTLVSIVAVLIMTFMMLVEGPGLIDRAWAFTDKTKLAKRKKLAQKMYESVTGYVNGQLLIALIASSIAFVVMVLLRVPNAVAMAGIVGMLGLIPLIGATLAAAIVVMSTMLVDVTLALIMAVYFLIYQQVENATIQPMIQGRKNDLSALTVFVVALLGVNIAGLLGAFIAIPAAGSAKVLIDDYLDGRSLRRQPPKKSKA